MPRKIDEIRAQFPQYQDVDDDTLTRAIYEADYKESGKSLQEFRAAVGVETTGQVASAIQGFGSGASLGFLDEIGAGVRGAVEKYVEPTTFAIGQKLGGGEMADMPFGELQEFYETGGATPKDIPFSKFYDPALESQREALAKAREENPWTTGLAEVAGGIATTAPLAAGAVAGKTVAGGAMSLAGRGALGGGAAGYGYSEGDPLAAALQSEGTVEDQQRVADELKEASIDVGIGAGLGGVLGPAIPALASTARAGFRGLLGKAPKAQEAILRERARGQLAGKLGGDLEKSTQNLRQMQEQLNVTPGMKIMDVSPEMRNVAEDIANSGTRMGSQMREALVQRTEQQMGRIEPSLVKALSTTSEPGTFTAVANRLQREAKATGKRMYDEAYKVPMRITAGMNKTLNRETAFQKQAMEIVNKLRRMDGKPPLDAKQGMMVSAKEMDMVLRGMDKAVSKEFKTGDLGHEFMAERNAFRQMLFDQNPKYEAARSVWAGSAKAQEALQAGRKIFRDDVDFTADMVEGLSTGELQNFRIGVLGELRKVMSKTADTADIVKTVFGNQHKRAAIAEAFGDEATFARFADQMKGEKEMFKTFAQATGGSDTARRLARQAGAGKTPVENIAGVLGASVSSKSGLPPFYGYGAGVSGMKGVKKLLGMDPTKMTKAQQRETTQLMQLLQGTDLETLMTPQTMGGLLETGMPTSAAQLTGGLIAAGQPRGLLE